MSRIPTHRHRIAILRMRLAHLPAILVTAALVLGFGWCTAVGWDSSMERCLARYDGARTAADSARVDRIGKSSRSRTSCGDLRRNGTLDRHQQVEARARAERQGG
jgi:hypothetical protein